MEYVKISLNRYDELKEKENALTKLSKDKETSVMLDYFKGRLIVNDKDGAIKALESEMECARGDIKTLEQTKYDNESKLMKLEKEKLFREWSDSDKAKKPFYKFW